MLQMTYLKNSSRIILVVGNTAITLAPLHHHRLLQPRIGHGRATQMAPIDGVAIGSIPVKFIRHRSSFSIPEVEEETTDESTQGYHPDHDTGRDACFVDTFGRLWFLLESACRKW